MVSTTAPYFETLEIYNAAHKKLNFKMGTPPLHLAIQHIMDLPGKRLRPLLLLECCKMCNGNIQTAIPIALAFEMFHNFTLVHDDIMDNAPLRRGQATVHEKFGTRQAILSGDLMLLYVYRLFENLPEKYYRNSLKTFTQCALQIMEGQQMDMNFETLQVVDEKEYLQMITYKTSVLLATAAQIGVFLADGDDAQQCLSYQFALQLGIAFQIKDDYLDLYGGSKVGKQIGGDILQNKKTYLQVLAWKHANEKQKQKLLHAKNLEGTTKIEVVVSIFNELNIAEKTVLKMQYFYKEALQNLSQINLPESQKSTLRFLAQAIFERNF